MIARLLTMLAFLCAIFVHDAQAQQVPNPVDWSTMRFKDFQSQFGAVPLLVGNSISCTWESTDKLVTCPEHVWTAADVALVASHNIKVILQYSGPSFATLYSFVTAATAGSATFTINDQPTTTNNAGALALKSASTLKISNGGSGYNFGSTVCFNYGGGQTQYTNICGTVRALQAVSAAVAAAGAGGTPGSYTCSLNPTLSTAVNSLGPVLGGSVNYALAGVQTTFTGTVGGGGTLSGLIAPSSAQYLALGGYTYNGSGQFAVVPVVCPGSGLTGAVTANVSMEVSQLISSLGRDATTGVFQAASASGWCTPGTPDTQLSSTDHGLGATLSGCGLQPALATVGYDNLAARKAASNYLLAIPTPIRPCIRVGGIFYTSPSQVATDQIAGPECWRGTGQWQSGFFEGSPGTYGEVFPFVDIGANGSTAFNGISITGTTGNQVGVVIADMTFWGDPTGTVDSVNHKGNVSAVRFYGSGGRSLLMNVNTAGLPGCLVCVGADSTGTGNFSEDTFINLRSGKSGDPWSRQPVIAEDAVVCGAPCTPVGSQPGSNNIATIRFRSDGDYYASIGVRGCVGSNGGGTQLSFDALKVEAGGLDNYNKASHEIILNDTDCDGSQSGTPIFFPKSDGTYVPGTAEGGVGDTRLEGTLASMPMTGAALYIGALGQNDVSNIRTDQINITGSGGGGMGIVAQGCNFSCVFDVTRLSATDYPLLLTSYPNVNQIANNVVEVNTHGYTVSNAVVDNGLAVRCPGAEALNAAPVNGSCSLASTNVTGSLSAPQTFPSFGTYGTRWTLPFVGGDNITAVSTAPGTNTVVCSPGLVLQQATLNFLGARTATTSNGNNVQLAIYNTGTWGRPSTLVAATGNIVLGVSAGEINGMVSAQVSPGTYWFCENADNNTVNFISYLATGPTGMEVLYGAPSQGNVIGTTGLQCGLSIAQTFGTWPAFTFGTAWTQTSTAVCPQIGFSIASVP